MLIGALYVLYGLPPGLYPAQVRSAAAGVSVGAGRVGSILGPLVAGGLRGAGWSAAQVLGAMVPVALIAGAAVGGVDPAAGVQGGGRRAIDPGSAGPYLNAG